MTTACDSPSASSLLSLRWLSRHRAALAAAVTVTLWASAFVGVRALGGAYSPGALAYGRITIGAAALGAITVRRGWRMPRGAALGTTLTYGAAWFAGYTVLFNTAARHLDAGTLALVINLAPLLVAVFAGVFLSEGLPRQLLVGIVVALVGIALIASGTSETATTVMGPGLLLGLLAAVLYAAGVLLQKTALRTVDAKTVTFLGCAAGSVALLPYAPSFITETTTVSSGAFVALVYLGLFPTALAFSTWTYALARSDAGRLAATALTVPAIVILLSWLILGELPTILAVAGGSLCLAGVVISRSRQFVFQRSFVPPSGDRR